MTYDLAFWEGPRPRDDGEALTIFEDLFPEDDEAEQPTPPTTRTEAPFT